MVRALIAWLRAPRIPLRVIDAGLAVTLAVAISLGITLAPPQGTEPDAVAYGLGLAIAALTMFRRRWPRLVLLAATALLQAYYLLDYPGLYPAVPLSVALATAWAAGHRVLSLVIAAWYALGPIGWAIYLGERGATEAAATAGTAAMSDVATFAAVLLLGEAMRTRRALEQEQRRSEALLLNVLPAPVADRLKHERGVIADAFPEATVLFADIVDFTSHSARTPPERVVETLNDLFSAFDELAARQGLEKIKTIGDAYMVACGLPEPRPDHAERVAEMALAMRDEAARRNGPDGRPLTLRIGIDTGPVVAGVIGRRKFLYDLWGDTVNTASRMESSGVPGCIQVTERTRDRLAGRYRLERRGPIQVKGKGRMVTWMLLGRAGG